MSIVSYKEYQGSVTYEDGVLVIQVLHVDDLLTTECASASDVESSFKELIDDYLETCKELGRKPQKSFKGSFNVRIDPDMHRRAANVAAEHDLSLNAWVAQAIQEKLIGDQENKRDYLEQIVSTHTRATYTDMIVRYARGQKTHIAKPVPQLGHGNEFGPGFQEYREGDDPKVRMVGGILSSVDARLHYLNPKITN